MEDNTMIFYFLIIGAIYTIILRFEDEIKIFIRTIKTAAKQIVSACFARG